MSIVGSTDYNLQHGARAPVHARLGPRSHEVPREDLHTDSVSVLYIAPDPPAAAPTLTREERNRCNHPMRHRAEANDLLACMVVATPQVCPPHLKKKVMCALDLDIDVEREKISAQALEDVLR